METKEYFVGKKIFVNDKMQKGYSYVIEQEFGEKASDFHQFPIEWFLSSSKKRSLEADHKINLFKVKSRLSLTEWKKKNWIIGSDPRGWFQWYCRYFIGRRTTFDKKQIYRWKSFKRHQGQIKINCGLKNILCRPAQRQALLQWAYSPFI